MRRIVRKRGEGVNLELDRMSANTEHYLGEGEAGLADEKANAAYAPRL